MQLLNVPLLVLLYGCFAVTLFVLRGEFLKTIVNVLTFISLGLLLTTFIGDVDWAIENRIYKIVGIILVIAAILKGIIVVSNGDGFENQ